MKPQNHNPKPLEALKPKIWKPLARRTAGDNDRNFIAVLLSQA